MNTRPQGLVERWAMRSKPKAFAFLIGLGLMISMALVGSVTAIAKIGMPHMTARIH